MKGRLARVLLVEDDRKLSGVLCDALASRAEVIVACATVAEVRAVAAQSADLVIVDVVLPDGTAFDVLDVLAGGPPVVAISGEAGPDQSFELSQRGVRAFLTKPFSVTALDSAIDRALEDPPSLSPLVRQTVGRRALHEMEDEVRDVMVDEALERAGGNRSHAARLLGISRQLLQHVLRRRGD